MAHCCELSIRISTRLPIFTEGAIFLTVRLMIQDGIFPAGNDILTINDMLSAKKGLQLSNIHN